MSSAGVALPLAAQTVVEAMATPDQILKQPDIAERKGT